MRHLPLFHNLHGRVCLIVGGGAVAARRARLVLSAGAAVIVLAPAMSREIRALATGSRITLRPHCFAPDSVQAIYRTPYALVVAATSDRRVNREVSRWARQQNLPVNVVDDPALCTVIMPAIVDRDPVTVAVATGGASPTLARVLRARLEILLPQTLGPLARRLPDLRRRLKRLLPDLATRTRIWGRALDDLISMRAAPEPHEIEQRLRREIYGAAQATTGTVFLTGAGPGDPELVTLAALRALQAADVIVHDRLVPEAVLALGRRDARRILMGKQAGQPSTRQEDIHELLIELARSGRTVCRLKGGDPFIFGRGGEELEALHRAGIPVRVIPGITAAGACAAAAGIPLTHRGHAHGVALLTAHDARTQGPQEWPAQESEAITRVYYMGATRLGAIRRQLIDAGHSPATPVAIVERCGYTDQRVLRGELSTLDAIQASKGIRSPALVIVGEVAGLAAHAATRHAESRSPSPWPTVDALARAAAKQAVNDTANRAQ